MTLALGKLRQVHTCIVHDNCSDGMAAAVLVHDALPTVAIRFMQYNTAEHEQLPAEPGLLLCDFSPPPARIAEFRAAGTLVLDHHHSVKDAVLSLGADGVYAEEPGVSGAVLTYQQVWLPLVGKTATLYVQQAAARMVQLIGIRDTWQTQSPDWTYAECMDAVLKFYDWDYWQQPFYRHDWAALRTLGERLVQRSAQQVQRLRAGAYLATSTHGVRVLLVQGVTQISQLSEVVATAADIVVGFLYLVEDGQTRLVYTCRSHAGVDVGALSKFHGGGGHQKSAGFTLTIDPATAPNPYQQFLACLDAYQEAP
jgi:hypothetical protein